MPRPAGYAASVASVEGPSTLFIVGGASSDFYTNYDTILTLADGQWTELPVSLSEARHDAAAVLIGEFHSGCLYML